jgi:endonuclease/exonuclease/phosphatase (EEP) superfamily protein YafD
VNKGQERQWRFQLARLLVWLSLLTSSATLFAFAARWWWPFELLSHFRLHYLLMLAPLTVGLLIAKRYTVAFLTVCCLVWNLTLVVPDFVGPPDHVGRSFPLRLMSSNVLTRNRNYEQFLQTVRAENPDVLLVMEIDDSWVRALEKLRGEYPYGESAPRADNFGIGLFSKVPVEEIKLIYIGSAGAPSIQVVLTVGDAKVNVLGTHPMPPIARRSALRNEQLVAVADLVAAMKGPTILAGDLNTTPWSPFFGDLLDRTGLRDSRCGFGNQATWPSRFGAAGIPIDHVLVSDDISVRNRHVGSILGSDHRSVITDLLIHCD